MNYSLDDASIREFVSKLNCIEGVRIEMTGEIKELKHQDYHSKSIEVAISDDFGNRRIMREEVRI